MKLATRSRPTSTPVTRRARVAGRQSLERPAARIGSNAFSDGVFAIAITLLVLGLTVPAGSGPLLPALADQWQEFLGYLVSFAFIRGRSIRAATPA